MVQIAYIVKSVIRPDAIDPVTNEVAPCPKLIIHLASTDGEMGHSLVIDWTPEAEAGVAVGDEIVGTFGLG